MGTKVLKKDAKKLIDKLPETFEWEDLMHEIYVRQAIESGLNDSKAGKVNDVSDVRNKYGLEILAVIRGAQNFPWGQKF
jgi:hypothetical protein